MITNHPETTMSLTPFINTSELAPGNLKFNVSKEEYKMIQHIVDRFYNNSAKEFRKNNPHVTQLHLRMDITQCHSNGCKLDLEAMYKGNASLVADDILNIYSNMCLDTGSFPDNIHLNFRQRENTLDDINSPEDFTQRIGAIRYGFNTCENGHQYLKDHYFFEAFLKSLKLRLAELNLNSHSTLLIPKENLLRYDLIKLLHQYIFAIPFLSDTQAIEYINKSQSRIEKSYNFLSYLRYTGVSILPINYTELASRIFLSENKQQIEILAPIVADEIIDLLEY